MKTKSVNNVRSKVVSQKSIQEENNKRNKVRKYRKVKINNDEEALKIQYNLFTGKPEGECNKVESKIVNDKNEYNKRIVTVDTKKGVRNVNTRTSKNSKKGKGSNDFERKGKRITEKLVVEILQDLAFKYVINLAVEYHFDRAGKYIEGASDRDYRLDYAFPALKIGIELDGGLNDPESGHRSISGIMKDMEKANRAIMNKWNYFRFSYFHTERYFKAVIEGKIKQLLRIKDEPKTQRPDVKKP